MILQIEISVPVVINTSWVAQGSNRDLCGDKMATMPEQWHDSYCTLLEYCIS